MISAIAALLSPDGYDLEAERREHVWEMNLLGDPMLHCAILERSNCRFPTGPTWRRLAVVGHSHTAGQLTLELAYRRDQVRRDLNGRRRPGDASGRDQYQQRYVSANQRVLVSRVVPIEAGEFTVELPIPSICSVASMRCAPYLRGSVLECRLSRDHIRASE